MKFHRVKVENLNSLYGVQSIDFEEDVRGAALFLIVGPTGAGKSTILDAICLALFGQTPRLERRVGRADTDVAHIMSIGTSHAYSEVEFSTLQADGSRARFLASWSARRAYDDPEGSVQRPERSLYRKFADGSMKLVVSDHREKYFQPGFDEALRGLSVDDFKRSILLAQGEFSAFLHASDGEKASILERLTSTDEYRRIGERASRRRRAVEDRHRALMLRLEEMQVLTIPQELELAEALEEATAGSDAARAHLAGATRQVEWLQTLEDLEERAEKAAESVDAAQKAVDERADDIEKLRRDSELLDVEPEWRDLEHASAKIAEATAKLGPLDTSLTELGDAEAALVTGVTTTQAALTASREAAEAAEPEIRKGHELRTRLDGARKQTDEASSIAQRHQATLTSIDAELQASRPLFVAASAALDAAQKRRDDVETARPLLSQLGSVRAKFDDGIGPLRQRLRSLHEQCATLDAAHKERTDAHAGFDEEIAAAKKERAKWQAQVTKAQNRLTAALDPFESLNAAVSALSTTLDAASARGEALREAKYLLQRIRDHESERDELRERVQRVEVEVAQLAADEAQLKELETTQRALVKSCDEALRQNERVIALSAYRRDLESGQPCPLCGSGLHPFCDSTELAVLDEQAAADRARLEVEQREAREALRLTNERVQMLANKFIARKTALGKDEARYFAIRTNLEEDQSAFSRSSEKAGYAPLEAFRLKSESLLETDLAEATTTADRTRLRLEEIESARQQLDRAELKLTGADETLAAVAQRTTAIDEELRQIADRLATRRADMVTVETDLEQRGVALVAELAQLGVVAPDEASIEEVLAVAATRHADVLAADASYATAVEARETAQQKVQRLDERRAEIAQTLVQAQELHGTRAAAVIELESQIATVLGGRDPSAVKLALDAAQREARQAFDAATQARARHAELVSAARARREELVAQVDGAQKALHRANTTLDATLDRLGIARAEVEVHLLPADTRKTLRTAIDLLIAAQTRAIDRRDDARERLKVHTELDLAPGELTLSDATVALETARQALSDITLHLGALRERWTKHEQTKSRRAEIEDELRTVQQDLDVWTTIYSLIGVRDGERFKLFAQSLNLQGLVDNANARLQRLHARYELTVARGEGGEPTLAFMVRDRYQANVERPLTTLSGGETFLVSLALALGLADFRRIDMPIETLLLDEGFGALDQDSLHMALTTLHQLHRDGSRQIGIISHVDALKELIDARIVVEPRGHGRSQLRFEYGAEPPGTQLELVTL